MKRTKWATLAMSISFLLGTIIALGSLISMGGTMDTAQLTAAPQFSVDYTTGPYPLLLGMGYLGGALYMLAYALLAAHFFRQGRTA
jgi:hypothetical protein